MRYAVVIEKGPYSHSAHGPDLPGCIAAGDSREEVLELIQEAIEMHLEAMRADGEAVPVPGCSFEYVDVDS